MREPFLWDANNIGPDHPMHICNRISTFILLQKVLTLFLASRNLCCLLITFTNSLDLDLDLQNVGPDLDSKQECLNFLFGKKVNFVKSQQMKTQA